VLLLLLLAETEADTDADADGLAGRMADWIVKGNLQKKEKVLRLTQEGSRLQGAGSNSFDFRVESS
jgi:hypothetical protein